MAQAYATSFGWAHAHPMKRKGDAHETLFLVFQHNTFWLEGQFVFSILYVHTQLNTPFYVGI
jgi:hypothetical protein